MFYLLRLIAGGGDFGNVGQRVKQIAFIAATGFLVEMLKDIFRNEMNPCRGFKCLFAVNVANFLIINIRINVHSLNVIHAEGEDVFIIDSVDDSISVDSVAKCLLGSKTAGILGGDFGIERENGRPRKAEHVVLLEVTNNRFMHVAKLAAVTLVKDNHNLFAVYSVRLVFLDKGREFLNGRYDDFRIGIGQLLFQYLCGSIAVSRALLETVVFPHGLIIQVFAVNDEKHFVNKRQARGNASRLE